MWRHGELHHYAACRWINEIYVIKWCPEWMLKFSNTDIKPLGPLLNYMTVIATAGFSSGRCLGVCLQICALKLSLELVVRIFVHIPSNSEMNMIIVSIAYKMIYYTSYIKFQHTWRWQLFVHWHQLFTIFWYCIFSFNTPCLVSTWYLHQDPFPSVLVVWVWILLLRECRTPLK